MGQFIFGHVKFELSCKHPSGDVTQAIGYKSTKFWAGDINFKVTTSKWIFKAMEQDEGPNEGGWSFKKKRGPKTALGQFPFLEQGKTKNLRKVAVD